jgi:hypothetical protein
MQKTEMLKQGVEVLVLINQFEYSQQEKATLLLHLADFSTEYSSPSLA